MSDDVLPSLRSFAGGPLHGRLPPHSPHCLGCGPDSAEGFGLQVHRDGDEVVATHTFTGRHTGAPGIAHGGAVATVVDDLLGFLLYVAETIGVTRSLEIGYRKPVLLGVPYVVRGRLDRREGRKLFVSCTGTDPAGETAFTGAGLFLAVPLEHFAVGSPAGPPVEAVPGAGELTG